MGRRGARAAAVLAGVPVAAAGPAMAVTLLVAGCGPGGRDDGPDRSGVDLAVRLVCGGSRAALTDVQSRIHEGLSVGDLDEVRNALVDGAASLERTLTDSGLPRGHEVYRQVAAVVGVLREAIIRYGDAAAVGAVTGAVDGLRAACARAEPGAG